MKIGIFLAYIVVGLFLAIPYILLAEGPANVGDPGWVLLLAPVFALIWIVAASFAGIIDPDNPSWRTINWHALRSKKFQLIPGTFTFFWVWTFYLSLPVLMNMAAIILESVGLTSLSSFIEKYKFASVGFIFYACVAMFLIILLASLVIEWLSNFIRKFTQ